MTRALALPAIAAVLGAYVVVHSPLNHSIAALLGASSSQCYPCGGTPGAGRAVDSLVALLFVALAVLAAAFLSALLADAAEEKLIAFGLIALAFVVLPSASLGAIGSARHVGLLRPPWGPLVCAAIALAIGLRRDWRPQRPRPELVRAQGLLLLVAVLGGGMVIASVFISLMHPRRKAML